MRHRNLLSLSWFLGFCITSCTSFTFSSLDPVKPKLSTTLSSRLRSRSPNQLYFFNFLKNDAATTDDSTAVLEDVRKEIEEMIISTQGRIDVETLEPALAKMEALCTINEPNRSPLYSGRWHVWYSNAPPPSNGKLGPFQGSSEQEIANDGSNDYNNILRLPPNSGDDEWLTILLKGIWEDWDGVELSEGNTPDMQTKPRTNEDWGARFWKVTFLSLNFSFFGTKIASVDFPPNTARVWRTTFLDDSTRIVRAGRTGRKEDESVFYMKRTPRPPTNP